MTPRIVETLHLVALVIDGVTYYYLRELLSAEEQADLEALMRTHEHQVYPVPIRGYTFRERMEAESEAMSLVDGVAQFHQEVLILRLLATVTGIEASLWEQMPYQVVLAVWSRIQEASQLPKLSDLKTSAGKPRSSVKGEPKASTPS